jgi:5-methylthioadenosine/S-adenosylhomocysteine deaminase
MEQEEIYKKLVSTIESDEQVREESEHGRIRKHSEKIQKILVRDVPYIFTCDENDKLTTLKNHSILIEGETIVEVNEAGKIKEKNFDLVYDASKRGGIVVTPGFINAHSHPPMYLLRSAMMLDEGESVDETIASMPLWERIMNDEDYSFSAVGDLTEQQKGGITTTLSHFSSFYPIEYSAKITKQNVINALSVASNVHLENSPELLIKILEKKEKIVSQAAICLHYLYKAKPEVLNEISKLVKKYNLLFTFHMAESPEVANKCVENHGMRETEVLEKYGLLNSNTVVSHAIHLSDSDIKKLVKNKVGIVHLPTSNAIHKSGTFQFWKFYDDGGKEQIALGTDSVVSKSRLDLLTEAYQTRITHLYSRTIKFGTLFKMMTINGARVLNMPDRGKIIPGMKADIAFWKLRDRGFIPYDEKNPITLIGNLITHGSRSVRDLMINGQFVIKDRRHQFVNETKLLEALQKEHMEMRKRREEKEKSR